MYTAVIISVHDCVINYYVHVRTIDAHITQPRRAMRVPSHGRHLLLVPGETRRIVDIRSGREQ